MAALFASLTKIEKSLGFAGLALEVRYIRWYGLDVGQLRPCGAPRRLLECRWQVRLFRCPKLLASRSPLHRQILECGHFPNAIGVDHGGADQGIREKDGTIDSLELRLLDAETSNRPVLAQQPTKDCTVQR